MLKLHFKDGRQAPVWLVDERFTLGQDRRNHLVLDDPDVSAFHAEIRMRGGFYHLSDCGSASGTFVNDQRITTQYQLRANDRVRLGSVELLLLDAEQARDRSKAAPRWFLQVLKGEHEGQKFHVQGTMSFGRSTKCELCFGDPELSRRHCEFFLKDDVLELKDLASANGVFVNQKQVDSAVLYPGDEVRMGSVTLLVIGPKVDARLTAEDDEDEDDATQFVKAVDLPKPARPQTAGPAPTANPLRAAAQAAAAPPAAAQKAEPNLLKLALLAGGLLVAAAAAGVLLVR